MASAMALICRVFGKETRAFYGLERLWGNATPVDVSALVTPPPASPRRA